MSPFQLHVLNFFYDDEDCCALTALVNDVRFHVIADKESLGRKGARREYGRLLCRVKKQAGDEVERSSGDSGVDVSHDENEQGRENGQAKGAGEQEDDDDDDHDHDAETDLHQWMLQPLQSAFQKLAPPDHTPPQRTLEQWYKSPTHFFDLHATDNHNDDLEAIELEPTPDLNNRITHLIHEITIPKYIRNIAVPWFSASDLTVLGGSDSPPPYHPASVRTPEGREYFLKLVDREQPGPVKREIHLLDRIAKLGLHNNDNNNDKNNDKNRIKCPKLEGLVTMSSNDHTKLLGFLQTQILDPRPLTTKLDTDVSQDLRERWAAESSRMRDVLHAHGIVWGDAKADNFMVDAEDELWMIDFGGSYTEGWVDQECNETVEGDDMGVEKITNALHDPVANVCDPDAEGEAGGEVAASATDGMEGGGKRKASENVAGAVDEENLGGQMAGSKRQKTHAGQVRYCFCDQPESGSMVGCDGEDCERQWFHFECVGLAQVPADDEEWYCPDCREAD
ncbi:hypothetical protein B0A50_05941 [Salinomyces thailandicus]|uniref:PHD-type domain-containing protein n=1 Tax=Salinomyces thailandicus TaxID=706561 RepID=A0A4U0TSN4_9PEZI|nr:hypothetical protein B0A50_05941 [Salinomyces thailandica]